MTASVAILETPVLRAADGSPPLGAGGKFFRDDQGEVFEYRSPNVKIIVLELDNGHWLAKPRGLGIDEDQYETRDEALESACDHMMRLARLYMAAGEGEGVHWTEDFGNGVIRWADGLKPKQGQVIQADSVASESECDHPITEQAAENLDVLANPDSKISDAEASDTTDQVIANQENLQDGGLNPEKDADTIPDPIVRALHEANRARRIFPSGHAFSR